jgi:hypothetical protein
MKGIVIDPMWGVDLPHQISVGKLPVVAQLNVTAQQSDPDARTDRAAQVRGWSCTNAQADQLLRVNAAEDSDAWMWVPVLAPVVVVAAPAISEELGPTGSIFGRTRLGGSSIFRINGPGNDALRFGWGWRATAARGTPVFRIAGDVLFKVTGLRHFDLFVPWW